MIQLLKILAPILYAVFLWWFTTGLIMAIYNRSRRVTHLFFAGWTVAVLVSVIGLYYTRYTADAASIYIAVTCGILIWGWQSASYYLGYVIGPEPKADNRFWAAVQHGLYHEVLCLAGIIGIAALTWNYTNQWGLWIYLALWLMHLSAKLNIFFGVRNFNLEMLPDHLHDVSELISQRTSNAFFPFSVAIASSVALTMIYQGIVPGAVETTGYLMVATMILLGVFEHWLLVLPLPATLWGWGLRPIKEQKLNAVPELEG